MSKQDSYTRIIEYIFLAKYKEGAQEFIFQREDIGIAAQELGITAPKNLGDVVYSFRYRKSLPNSISSKAPNGYTWIIRPAGTSRYSFVAVPDQPLIPNSLLSETKIPDSTPGIVGMYALNDEQALLAKLRYNRLIDIFTGVTCYSLQNHLRTNIKNVGQIETDELYIGVDRKGAHHVFPVQAKGGKDRLSIVQIEQDFALCDAKFSSLICRPIAAQFMGQDLIALFELERSNGRVCVANEKHYRLVPFKDISLDDLSLYRERLDNIV